MRLRSQESSAKPSPGSAGLYLHGHGLPPRQPERTPTPPPAPQLPSGRGDSGSVCNSHAQISEAAAALHRLKAGSAESTGDSFSRSQPFVMQQILLCAPFVLG